MNEVYGFKQEVIHKYSLSVFNLFSELFKYLPIAHLINDKVLVIHGGLPEDPKVTLQDMEKFQRFKEPSEGSPMFDLLWCDPSDSKGRPPSARGVSTSFGPDITEEFCKRNNIELVIRSHEAQMEGYKVMHNSKCVTIFSAPNYCDEMKNKAAIIHLKEDLKPSFITFEASPHPPGEKFMTNLYNLA
ncbi:Serine/threonine-protein phosphatase 5 [Thelohanellus kitauei]|uniref:Serine/threonine-protein phosphatase 5 n=1 Tax=Thelohanellus kitauei TaxID=669202 RepID=A0A0C2NDU4_THEKT|nr:Serine/threonine-protein phosphatase 5 [Thelohanellus kitauei]